MPIYEYQCQLCHHQLETLQKTTDEPLITCPACGKEGLIKLVSASSFQLKGTGWYATDFRTKQTPAPANAENASSKEGSNNNTTDSSETSKKSDNTSGDGEAA